MFSTHAWAVALTGGKVNWLRQLKRADLEAGGLGDFNEENLDPDLNGQNNRGLPCAGRAEAEVQSKGGKRDAKESWLSP